MKRTTVLMLSALVTAGPALAQSEARLWELCEAADSQPARAIDACTKLANSGASARERAGALVNRALAFKRQKAFDRALADYDAAIRIDPGLATALQNRGALFLEKGDFDRAISDFTETIRLRPGVARTHFSRGEAHFAKKDWDRAIQDYSQAIRLDAANTPSLIGRGNAYLNLNQPDQAIADASAAIRYNPNAVNAYLLRARAYFEKLDFAPAIDDLTVVLRRNPDHIAALIDRGLAYRFNFQHTEAVADFTAVIRLVPNSPTAYTFRCGARIPLNQLIEAAEDCDHAMKLKPGPSGMVMTAYQMAYISLKAGNPQAAIRIFDAALRHHPDNMYALYGRSLAKQRIGDTEGAAADLAAAKTAAKEINADVEEETRKAGLIP